MLSLDLRYADVDDDLSSAVGYQGPPSKGAFFSADRDPGLELPAHTEATLPWCPGCLEDGSGGVVPESMQHARESKNTDLPICPTYRIGRRDHPCCSLLTLVLLGLNLRERRKKLVLQEHLS